MSLYGEYNFITIPGVKIIPVYDTVYAMLTIESLNNMDWDMRITAYDESGYSHTFIIMKIISISYDCKNSEWVILVELTEEF